MARVVLGEPHLMEGGSLDDHAFGIGALFYFVAGVFALSAALMLVLPLTHTRGAKEA